MNVIQAIKTRKKYLQKFLNNCAASNKLTTTFHMLPRISVLCTNFPSAFCYGSY